MSQSTQTDQDQIQKDLIARLKRIEGQARGIQRMVEEGQDCQQVLNQLTAMRNATHKVSLMLVQNHAAQCLSDAADAGGPPADVGKLVELISKAVS